MSLKIGKYEGECEIEQDGYSLEIITQLFVRYHHSVPSERSVSKRKNYFIALPEQKLSDEDMLYGEAREVAQIKLELYVLLAIMTGNFKWMILLRINGFGNHLTIKTLSC